MACNKRKLCESFGILPGRKGTDGKPGTDGPPGRSIPGPPGASGPRGPQGGVTLLESKLEFPEMVYVDGTGPATTTASVILSPPGGLFAQFVPFQMQSSLTGDLRFRIPQFLPFFFGMPIFGSCFAISESGKMYQLRQVLTGAFYTFQAFSPIVNDGSDFTIILTLGIPGP